ncbi:methionine ABC transporter ATP-binding protein [Methylobacterium planeticum]|uniref:Cell division ATP-binding protein FtsE n=1 Tax=Methylobacterium planeticum TaxID=2615211 RepID=A0A6N6MP76_9HYPH|nr:methionine ABC transporter ATP-binding protein [Methylobacterium planeticum]KAB1071814.1 methionine ABC transporter ATP-binding protein [Methylobacterium planeticum]
MPFDRPNTDPRIASQPLISFEGVSKTYATRQRTSVSALADIDLAVPAGSVLGVIGRSGAGKSTLIRLVNGLERPDVGRIRVGDAEISALDERALRRVRRGVGMIFQHFNLLSSRSAFGNIALPLEIEGRGKAEIRARVEELLALTGLEDQRDRYPSELSGGQKQRVGIARALATGPSVLLSDEATSALDPETTRAILALLRRINRELGLTILLITHEMSVIRAIADRVAVLENGRIVEQGDVFEVFTRPQAEVTRTLLAGEMGLTLPAALAAQLGREPVSGAAAVLRIAFRGPHANDPIVARLARETGIEANILSGTVDEIAGQPFGSLAVSLPAGPDVVVRARAFLDAHGLVSDLLGYLPARSAEDRHVA